MPTLYWLDLETTGLNPSHDKILEVAVAVADFLNPFDATHVYNEVAWFPPSPDRAREMQWATTAVAVAEKHWSCLDPYIINMHTKNGLFRACESGVAIDEIERDLLDIVPWVEDKEDKPILAGSSIHFDHSFIAYHMPELARRFSHRHYDVSALKMFCQSMGMPKLRKAEAHRAQDDIRETIEHARECATWLRESLLPLRVPSKHVTVPVEAEVSDWRSRRAPGRA